MEYKILGNEMQFWERRSVLSWWFWSPLESLTWWHCWTCPHNPAFSWSCLSHTGAATPGSSSPRLSSANPTAQLAAGAYKAEKSLFTLLSLFPPRNKFVTNPQSKKPQEKVVSRCGKGNYAWEQELCMWKESQLPQCNGRGEMKREIWTYVCEVRLL